MGTLSNLTACRRDRSCERTSATAEDEATRRLLNWPTPPRAIFAAADQLGIGALKAIHQAGLRCPEDIAIVSYDGTTESEYCWPPLTVAQQPIQAMAKAAVQLVPRTQLKRRLPAIPNRAHHHDRVVLLPDSGTIYQRSLGELLR